MCEPKQPEWMRIFITSTEVVTHEYFVAAAPTSPVSKTGICICSPNKIDQNRDCPVHEHRSMTFGLEKHEIQRGGLD